MPTINLSEEEYQFLKELAHELRTQDNRMTASPYFYTIVTYRLYPALEDTGCGPTQFTDTGDGDAFTANTRAEVEKVITEAYAPDPVPEGRFDEILEYGTHMVQENHNVFLTEKACNQYLEKNSHKLCSRSKPQSYVDYADRNPEMARLLDILRKIE